MVNTTVLYVIALALLILLGIFGVYVPGKIEESKKKKYLESLKKGDPVITMHGIKGRVDSVTEDTVIIRSEPDNVRFEIAKWGLRNKQTVKKG